MDKGLNVALGPRPINHQIIYRLQDIFNLLPNLNVEELIKAFAVKTNDMMLAIYLSSIIRAVVALHNLVDNRLVNKDKERASDEAAAKKEKGERRGRQGQGLRTARTERARIGKEAKKDEEKKFQREKEAGRGERVDDRWQMANTDILAREATRSPRRRPSRSS